jgi:hypothetical protein
MEIDHDRQSITIDGIEGQPGPKTFTYDFVFDSCSDPDGPNHANQVRKFEYIIIRRLILLDISIVQTRSARIIEPGEEVYMMTSCVNND